MRFLKKIKRKNTKIIFSKIIKNRCFLKKILYMKICGFLWEIPAKTRKKAYKNQEVFYIEKTRKNSFKNLWQKIFRFLFFKDIFCQ